MLKELYIFSNQPTPPVTKFNQGLTNEYAELSVYLNPEVAAAPSYNYTAPNNSLENMKNDTGNYEFVHVYKFDGYENTGSDGINETLNYVYSHKEFNIPGKRKLA